MEATKPRSRSRYPVTKQKQKTALPHEHAIELDRDHNNRAAGRSLYQFSDQALLNDVMVAGTIYGVDFRGYDLIAEYFGKYTRLQVRCCARKRGQKPPAVPPNSYTFSIIRSKKKKLVKRGIKTFTRHFEPHEVDAFVFIDVDNYRIFIVPTAAINLRRTKFTVRVDGPWLDAWRFLK